MPCYHGGSLFALFTIILDISVDSLSDDPFGLFVARDLVYGGLLALKLLIDLEEMLHFFVDMLRNFGNVLITVIGRVSYGNGDYLLVVPSVIDHGYNADRIASYLGHGKQGLTAEHQYVEGIEVVSVGSRNKAVVGGIVGRGVKNSVENKNSCFFIKLVLTLAALLNLDNRYKILGVYAFRAYIVPDVQSITPLYKL